MSQKIVILGSTGSIGRQSLDVIAACGMEVVALTASSSIDLLEVQCRQFRPKLAVLMTEEGALELKSRLSDLDADIEIQWGMDELISAAEHPDADTVVTAVVGMVGLRPTLAAIKAGKRIALANKETLVCAGELVMSAAAEFGAEIVPVDSEHSALFQSLQGCRDRGEVKRLILTCSGGPFYGRSRESLIGVTKYDALKHPNWDMGAKITIDSATLMNKGLEFIEAMHLYAVPPEKISIVVHRESIIHSLVEYCDNGMIAQLGTPDMRLPIQYALTYPARTAGAGTELDLLTCGSLTFGEPDPATFRCLGLALEAAQRGGTAGAVLNGANEAAVALFLADKIEFLDIATRVERAVNTVPHIQNPTLEEILQADRLAREAVYSL